MSEEEKYEHKEIKGTTGETYPVHLFNNWNQFHKGAVKQRLFFGALKQLYLDGFR